MQTESDCYLVLVTSPGLEVARAIARNALQQQLVACANLIPQIESHYWWENKLESSTEVLILFKTTKAQLPRLETLILTHHPYDTPEFIALAIDAGTPRYLEWITKSCVG